MPISFSDLQLAFEFVSSGGMGENEAYLDRRSGKIYWHSEFGENDARSSERCRAAEPTRSNTIGAIAHGPNNCRPQAPGGYGC